jgi:hypothetical protein
MAEFMPVKGMRLSGGGSAVAAVTARIRQRTARSGVELVSGGEKHMISLHVSGYGSLI